VTAALLDLPRYETIEDIDRLISATGCWSASG
jgi:hypothetical protein